MGGRRVRDLLQCASCGGDFAEAPPGLLCVECGAGWVREGPVWLPAEGATTRGGLTAASERFFDSHAASHEHDASEEETARDAETNVLGRLAAFDYRSRIAELIERGAANVVVELGCGTGRNLAVVLDAAGGRPVTLIGCDVSGAALQTAAERLAALIPKNGSERMALLRADGASAPLRSGVADLVLLVHVLHHAGELALVQRARRALAPGGQLYLVDIAAENPFYALSRAAWRWLPRRLRRRFTDDFCVDGEAAPVRLVRRADLDGITRTLGLRLVRSDDCGLFLFLLYYAARLLPRVAQRVPARWWHALADLEARLLSLPGVSRYATNIARLYELPLNLA